MSLTAWFAVGVDAGVVSVDAHLITVDSVEVGGEYWFRRRFRSLPEYRIRAYPAKVRIASSSLVSRYTP
jgi:hypothetical protein